MNTLQEAGLRWTMTEDPCRDRGATPGERSASFASLLSDHKYDIHTNIIMCFLLVSVVLVCLISDIHLVL